MIKKILIWLKNSDLKYLCLNDKQLNRIILAFPKRTIVNAQNLDEFLADIIDADAAVIWRFKQEWLEKAPKLSLIITPSAGKDFFHVEPRHGLRLEYSSFHGKIMAETAIGMMLSHARGILKSYRLQKSEQWPRGEIEKVLKPLYLSTVTILGFGHIGNRIGILAKALGMRVIGVKRTVCKPPEYFDKNDMIIKISELRSVLPLTDHLMVCLPNERETDNLINYETLLHLPSHAALYNIGRGNSVNEEDLDRALSERKIAGAYLDVFKNEPLDMDSPLRKHDNCLVMPHMSAISEDYLDLFIDELIEKIKCFDNNV